MVLIYWGILLLTHAALSQNVEDACPSLPVKLMGKKYFEIKNDMCYFFMVNNTIGFDEARLECNGTGGTLAMPKTKDINDLFILKMHELGHLKPMWIGMTDLEKEGSMVWEDGSEVKDWGNFDWGTNGLFGEVEHCVGLNPRDGLWHDFRCLHRGFLAQNKRLSFICQYPVAQGNAKTAQHDDDDSVDVDAKTY